MSETKRYTIRLDSAVAEYYESLAASQDEKPSTFLSRVLTNHHQTIGIKHQADRIEDLVDRVEKRIEEFEDNNNFNEKFYEDFSGLYFMMLWVMMKSNASKDEIRAIQAKGYTYADENYKGALK
ncbi:hypothetical protein [Acinetobacter lwoffii]|uniref:hypothetical protein n=1 Tax=Acinetobacter lwoffii TaxID=28090 RepID=UPI003BF671D7